MAVDEAWHEKSPLRIKLSASSNWRTANGPDSATRNSDIVQSLKYGRTIEDSRVVNYEFAPITFVGSHLRALFICAVVQPRFLLSDLREDPGRVTPKTGFFRPPDHMDMLLQ